MGYHTIMVLKTKISTRPTETKSCLFVPETILEEVVKRSTLTSVGPQRPSTPTHDSRVAEL